jgi:hypothetical protein
MDYASIVSALPQETIDAVASAPDGLTATSQVEVAEFWSNSTDTIRALWIVPPEYTKHGPLVGGVLATWTFTLVLTKASGTNAEMEALAEQIRAHFDGRKVPASITDMVSSHVGDIVLRTDRAGGDVEIAMEIGFTGVKRPGTT